MFLVTGEYRIQRDGDVYPYGIFRQISVYQFVMTFSSLFDVPDAFGMVSEENSIIYDNKSKKVVYDKGKKGYNLKRGMAYLQKLYDDLSAK